MDIDVTIGRRIKSRRLELGMTQTELADKIDVRFQQVQKYENGQNRVAASRLWQVSRALNVSVEYFFSDVNNHNAINSVEANRTNPRQTKEIVNIISALPDEKRGAMMSFMRSLV